MKKFFPVLQYMNIPNMITTVGLVFGIAACYFLLIEGSLRWALVCLSLAMFMDLVDGYVAEKLGQQTEFGQYVDTLVDFFICCIIPILLVYLFVGSHFVLLAALVFYVACGLWRLAYYNAREADNFFVGLPVPGAMLLVIMAVWSVVYFYMPSWVVYAALVSAGFLMVSFVRLEKYGLWQKGLWVLGVLFFVMVMFS